jgi:tetratricopeptide (TPR) repeat protein
MLNLRIPAWLCAGAMGLALFAFAPERGIAASESPAPTIKPKSPTTTKPKPKPKTKPKPKPKESSLTQDQVYSLGYWQAKGGMYAEALATLRSAKDQGDPRVQTMIGFSLRKLGRIDEAMDAYLRVLSAYPDRTNTRQYLGEAFLQIGEPDKAREQLAEIARRCGVACEDYQQLADEIAKYQEKKAG